MVYIPSGDFIMGQRGEATTLQGQKVSLEAFFIDRFEVTRERFKNFKPDFSFHPKKAQFPVSLVTFQKAQEYCVWKGMRLPTEAEWEKAARGTDGRRYPWGHMQPFVDIARYNFNTGWVSYKTTLAAVTSGTEGMSIRHGLKQGTKSPYGLYHMAGNASEWVADWYDRTYYEESE